jgi:ABC-type sugar transport system ATPase subunit
MGVVLRSGAVRRRAEHRQQTLKIKMTTPDVHAGELSGGNQQKVLFAKWLEADPKVVLLDDPSRGVDVGAKDELHGIIAQIAARGRVVIYTSSDLEEMASVCDRVIVFFAGRAVGEVAGDELSGHHLLEAINVGSVSVAA